MKIHKIIGFGLLLLSTVACASKERPSKAESERSGRDFCGASDRYPPSNKWSLGDPYSASLIVHEGGGAIICVYQNGVAVIDSVEIKLARDEFVASQTCSDRNHESLSVFGIGIRDQGNVHLRMAWSFDKNAQRLSQIDPHQVKCVYSEMDE